MDKVTWNTQLNYAKQWRGLAQVVTIHRFPICLCAIPLCEYDMSLWLLITVPVNRVRVFPCRIHDALNTCNLVCNIVRQDNSWTEHYMRAMAIKRLVRFKHALLFFIDASVLKSISLDMVRDQTNLPSVFLSASVSVPFCLHQTSGLLHGCIQCSKTSRSFVLVYCLPSRVLNTYF